MTESAGAPTTQSCLFCGEPIEPTAIDPRSAVLTAWVALAFLDLAEGAPGGGPAS